MERKYAPLICSASENPYSSDEFVIYLATEVDAHLAALQAQHAEAELVIADLAMMLRRMIHRIRRTGSGTEIANAATDLLKRHGQQGSILRQGMP